jgi:hypothetical protein
MGGRSARGLEEYFITLSRLFSSLKKYIHDDALVLQLVAFADLEKQLPEFLKAMDEAGYQEIFPLNDGDHVSIETVLFHKLK